jgi:hypothetical protein
VSSGYYDVATVAATNEDTTNAEYDRPKALLILGSDCSAVDAV